MLEFGAFILPNETKEPMNVVDQVREDELEAVDQYRRGLQPAPVFYRASGFKVETKEDGPMVFVASEESEDRMGDVITADGWELANFKKNPMFLYLHDQTFPPLGTWSNVKVEGKQLLASPVWDEGDEFAQLIKGKYQRSIMRAVSVGFRAIEVEDRVRSDDPGRTGLLFKQQELLEISAVAIPAHPKTLRRALGIRSHFWVPFQVDALTQIGDMRKQLTTIRDEANELLKGFTPEKPLPMPEANELEDELARYGDIGAAVFKYVPEGNIDGRTTETVADNQWDEVLKEIAEIANTEGG